MGMGVVDWKKGKGTPGEKERTGRPKRACSVESESLFKVVSTRRLFSSADLVHAVFREKLPVGE